LCRYTSEHLSLVKRMILGATSTIRIMSCYFFANESPFVNVVKDLLPQAARRGVRVRLLLDALPAQSALVKATMWGPLLTPYVQGSKDRLEFVEFYKHTLPAAAEGCPPGTFRVAFFKATDARGGYAIKSHMKMFGADGRLAIIGGSNMLPTAATRNNDWWTARQPRSSTPTSGRCGWSRRAKPSIPPRRSSSWAAPFPRLTRRRRRRRRRSPGWLHRHQPHYQPREEVKKKPSSRPRINPIIPWRRAARCSGTSAERASPPS
jgi:phosphatidylserine/phosphatidylglycerophosphate/cardiolipin synthase-like enzyme